MRKLEQKRERVEISPSARFKRGNDMDNLMRLTLEELIKIRNRRGGRILGRHLAKKVGTDERALRAAISQLRAEGFPILGYTGGAEGGAGYWISSDIKEIQDWLNVNRGRILIQLKAYNGVKRNARKYVFPKQIEIRI